MDIYYKFNIISTIQLYGYRQDVRFSLMCDSLQITDLVCISSDIFTCRKSQSHSDTLFSYLKGVLSLVQHERDFDMVYIIFFKNTY